MSFSGWPARSGQMPSKSTSIVFGNSSRSSAPRLKFIPSAVSDIVFPKANSAMRFKSISARIIFLHVIAVVIVSVFMPLALYWLLNRETNALHDHAMRQQADSIAQHLVLGADGSRTLDLPPSLRDLYSKAYGRYSYSIVDETGKVLFSSLDESTPIFPSDAHSTDLVFLETR